MKKRIASKHPSDSLQSIRASITTALEQATNGLISRETLVLETPPSPAMGDFAFKTFALAKEQKKNPAEVAKELATTLKPTNLISRCVAAGPYLNIFLDRGVVSESVLASIHSNKGYGRGSAFKKEKIVLEYVQPNTNKPLHLGHLRNALLGSTIARLLETQGASVVLTNIVNDRGIHIAKTLLAYERWGEGTTPTSSGVKGDHFVGNLYVRFEQELAKEKAAWQAKNPKGTDEAFLTESTLMREAQDVLKKWEVGDRAVRALWKKMRTWVLDGFLTTYEAIGIHFQKEYFESEIFEEGRAAIDHGLKKGAFRKEKNGAVVAPLQERHSLPDKVLLRADGTALYITQDLALARQKEKDFHPTRSLYVVGSEQELYFKQLFAILTLLNFPHADKLFHVSYGLVFLPEGKMKSREGKVVDTDDLLKEMEELATTELATRYPDLSVAERSKRAQAIALSAIKFHFLMVGRTSPVHFNPKESLSFEGNTGPYLQYTFARATSILAKTGEPALNVPTAFSEVGDSEWSVLRLLLEYPRILAEAAERYDPAHLCTFLLQLAQAFNAFYHAEPVLEAPAGVRPFRLALVGALRDVLGSGLDLLGIERLGVM
jgi:arginyl-tRNA synthetase